MAEAMRKRSGPGKGAAKLTSEILGECRQNSIRSSTVSNVTSAVGRSFQSERPCFLQEKREEPQKEPEGENKAAQRLNQPP